MKGTLPADEGKPPAQGGVIDFLRDSSGRSPWVKFLIEYHRLPANQPKIVLLRAKPPLFPVFDRAFRPQYPHPTDKDRPPNNDSPGQTGHPDGHGGDDNGQTAS
jgi:hypothetical protein